MDHRTEFDESDHKKGRINQIKDDGPNREKVFDEALAFEGQKAHCRQHDDNTQHIGESEVISQDNACGRSDDSQYEKDLNSIDDLEQKPEGAEQLFKESAVVICFELPAEFERHRQNDRPHHRCDQKHPQEPAQRSVVEKKLH